MDNLTHTLFGATLARTPLDRAGRGTTAALVLASNAPDIDIVTIAGGALSYLQWHRGPTHGPLGVVALGLVVAGVVWTGRRVFDRLRLPGVRRERFGARGSSGVEPRRGENEPARFGALAVVSILGVLFHVLMDLPTSYGTRLLSPFDWHWFAVDLMPIIDPYLLIGLAACLWFAKRPESRQRYVAIALLVTAVNYGVRFVAHREALSAAPRIFGPTLPGRCDAAIGRRPLVDRWPTNGDLSPRDTGRRCLLEIAALPTFSSPFRWRLVAHLSNAFETLDIDLVDFARGPSDAPEAPWRQVRRYPKYWTAAALQAATARTVQVFLGFSRFAVVRSSTDRSGATTVAWSDLRFTIGPPRSRADEQRAGFFQATVVIGPDGEIAQERLGP